MRKLKDFLDHYYSKIDDKIVDEKIKLLSSINSINKEAAANIKLAVSLLDLTTLEGNDTKEKVISLCNKAVYPDSDDLALPHCATICVYPNLIKYAKKALKGSKVKIASVATSFPSGQFPLKLKLADVKYCIHKGANEIDMVISRGEFLMGNFQYVFDEIKQVNKICKSKRLKKPVKLKVILETGELGSLDNVRVASLIAIKAGADFIKTSTGKIKPAATLPVMYVMCEAIKNYYNETGKKVGIKAAGGIRITKEAFEYMNIVKEILGDDWLKPDLFRIGASSLLSDLIAEYKKFNL